MKAVILANGDFPNSNTLRDELRNAQFLAVCDGAIRHLEALGIQPNVIVGDLDSITENLREKYAQKIVHISEQESNDLSKTFFYCCALGFEDFVILGATGKREDHSIANISLLSVFFKHCKQVVMKSDFGIFSIGQTPCKIASERGEQISLFSFNPSAKFTSQGLKYPLEALSLPIWANGTLNEALGSGFSLQSQPQGELVLIYRFKG